MPEESTPHEESTPPEAAGDEARSYPREVKDALQQDDQRLGLIWRKQQDGQTAKEIAEELGVSGVYNYRKYIDAIVKGDMPKAPSIARQCASALRSFSGRHEESLSEETRKEIARRASECDKTADDPVKKKEEERVLERETRARDRGPGIYVFTLPHYHYNPVEAATDDRADPRTYLKVGRSGADVRDRVNQAKREAGFTGLPESPLMLRKYQCPDGADLKTIEGKIHRLLEDADHLKNKESTQGKEWFLTHLKFLDSITALIGLTIEFDFEKHLPS